MTECKTTNFPNGIDVGNCLLLEDGIDLSAFFKKQVFISSDTIDDDTDLAMSTGTNTLIMPTTPTKGILECKSISGTITLDPGTNTVENGNTVSTTVNRRFNLEATVWREL